MAQRQTRARPASAFTQVRRVAHLGVYDRDSIHAVLDAATHATVAHVIDGRPVAIPTLHWRIGERVYWHGSVASRMLKSHAQPGEVCLTAMVFDGWVLARSAFNHTVNYRSVLCFGRPESVEDAAEKTRVLKAFMDHWFPGRWERLRPVNKRELGATAIYSIPLTEASAKIRDGGVDDPPKDVSWPVWAGVVPVAERLGRPIADVGVSAGAMPPSMPRLRRRAPKQDGRP
jgi:nitroimidazol reductase NimA-like FMN-containing flavoprotein (pyridoxamine 5'-phosphate oxidase superfamily)